MIGRHLSVKLKEISRGFPSIFVTGPRQSGKTTLVRTVFPSHHYVSLENPDEQEFAFSDPKGFLLRYKPPCILDEVQRVPKILSYLQGRIDEDPKPGQWILTGSQQYLLMEKISQTLAGRIAVVRLLPFSLAELQEVAINDPVLSLKTPRTTRKPAINLFETLYTGFFPPVHNHRITPRDWYASYYQTYVERDVRDVLKIGDLATFRRFIRLCAGRSGNIVNYSSLAMDAGISPPTARAWMSVLEASSILFLLHPHYRNFSKRLIKSPKLYFLDTGLLCYLLEIRKPSDIEIHPLRGALFETLVVSGIVKLFSHAGENPPLYFWRDHVGHEVDLIVDLGREVLPVEIKGTHTVTQETFREVQRWLSLKGNRQDFGLMICAISEAFQRQNILIQPWWAF